MQKTWNPSSNFFYETQFCQSTFSLLLSKESLIQILTCPCSHYSLIVTLVLDLMIIILVLLLLQIKLGLVVVCKLFDAFKTIKFVSMYTIFIMNLKNHHCLTCYLCTRMQNIFSILTCITHFKLLHDHWAFSCCVSYDITVKLTSLS